ncbi:hypothetical protein COO60DRAFT_1698391 [Scenedesmus sp. NREL 46B-D3]|nr:hypothetical protein COO60DRAFT_1698391 [Scenedesmus sp. NREL 46B-D3]
MEQRGTAPHKESVVLLAYSEAKKKHYIVAKPAHSSKAQLIRIDPESGVLKWDQAVGRDTFDNEAEALAYLQEQGRTEVLAHGKAVLGYAVLGPVALLLLAEAVRVSGALPGGHEIKTVTQSKWHRINLQQPELDPISQAAAKAELDRGVDKTTNFPVDGAHYYCETLDISRPFPSERPPHQPSWAFVWNKALSMPFRNAGLDGPQTVCPALLQGMAESRDMEDFDGRRFGYCLISRRCRLHVGPRYKARGLNEAADPGNEIECDQVVWKHSTAAGKPLAWSRYTWRRGSVPMWWTVNIRNGGMGEAEIKIRTTNTFRGSRRYVRRLQRRYMPNPHLEPDGEQAAAAAAAAPAGSQDASLQVPVVFFSLLRKGTPDRDRSEAKLADAFDFLAGQLRSVHKLPVSYVALDWHQMDKELGSEALVEAFWSQLGALLPPQSFALGTLVKVGPDHTNHDGLDMDAAAGSAAAVAGNGAAAAAAAGRQGYSSAGQGWVARWFKQQRGVTRYNCADSLDRTNVGSFFGAVQVFVEQCRELDIAIAATSASAASMARQALLRRQAAAAAAAATAAGSAGVAGAAAAAAAAGAAGRLPLAAAAPGALTQDKRTGSGSGAGGSSGFLSSLGKAVMGDLRISPRSPGGNPAGASSGSSPSGGASGECGRDLRKELRVQSSPNISLMQQQQQQQFQQQQQQQQQLLGQQQEPPLPPGWEAKYDAVNKRVFYVDHNTKTTTWSRPQAAAPAAAAASTGDVAAAAAAAADPPAGTGSSNGHVPASGSSSEQQSAVLASSSRGSASLHHKRPGSLARKSLTADDGASGSDSDSGADKERYEPLTPWCMFSPRHARVRHFARVINAPALSGIAELFLMNGDMCAWLYTGSPAMHSEKITMFEPESSRLKKAGAGAYSNSFIAIRRRYNNVLMDEERKMQAEMFLGLKARLYFPTLHLAYREPEGGVPDDWPESDDDEPTASGEVGDPLGLLTWPLESSKTARGSIASSAAAGLAGAAAALVGLAGSGIAAGGAAGGGTGLSLLSGSGRTDRERLSSGSSFSESPDFMVERPPSHTRSFSSEKILQEFRELQRAGQAHAQAQPHLLGQPSPGRPPLMPPAPVSTGTSAHNSPSSFTKPMPAAAAAATGAAAASLGARSMADFDQELSDRAPTAASHFVHNIEPLAEQYAVYAVDLLGHGGSWPSQQFCEHSGQQLHYNVATYTEQLHSFIQEKIGQPVYVAGNSLGGFLAANLAAHHPEAVRGVVLLNAAPFTSPYIPGRDLLLWRLLAAAADDALPAPHEQIASFVRSFWWDVIRQPDSIRLVLQLVYARHSAIDDQLVQCILEPTRHPQALGAFISMVLSPAGKLSFDEVLQAVECPVCLAYGREDPWVAPLYGHRAKRLLPSAVYLELSPAGHCPHHEAPTAVNSIIATFVAAVEAGQQHQHALMQAGSVTSFDEAGGCTVQVACVDGSPRNLLEAADAALWRLGRRAAALLRRH